MSFRSMVPFMCAIGTMHMWLFVVGVMVMAAAVPTLMAHQGLQSLLALLRGQLTQLHNATHVLTRSLLDDASAPLAPQTWFSSQAIG